MAHYNWEEIPLIPRFFSPAATPIPEPSSRHYSSYDHSRQLIIEHLYSTSVTPRDYTLDYRTARGVIGSTERLYSGIFSTQQRLYGNVFSTSSWLQSLATRSAYPEPSAYVRHIIIRRFLSGCIKSIRGFLEHWKEDMSACKTGDVQNLQNALQGRLEFLIGSLCHDQQLKTMTENLMQELGPVIENILQLLWQFHYMPLPEHIPRSSLVALDHPVLLFVPTNRETCIPIPRIFCDSQPNLHKFLQSFFRTRQWHAKVDQGDYILEDKALTTDIGAHNWHDVVIPGAQIFMTMVFKRKGLISESCCPSCHATSIEKVPDSRKLKCLNCKLISDVIESSETSNDIPFKNSTSEDPEDPADLDEATFSRIRYFHEKVKSRGEIRYINPESFLHRGESVDNAPEVPSRRVPSMSFSLKTKLGSKPQPASLDIAPKLSNSHRVASNAPRIPTKLGRKPQPASGTIPRSRTRTIFDSKPRSNPFTMTVDPHEPRKPRR